MRQRRDLADDSTAESLRTIIKESDRLDAMTASLLDISRVRVGRVPLRIEQLDVASAVQRAFLALPELPANVSVESDAAELTVAADAARVTQIVRTILSFLSQRDGAGSIVARLSRAAGAVQVDIEDDGTSLEPEAAAQLFSRLIEPAPNQASGWKIARPELYIARGLAKAHGGALQVDSPIGGGQQGIRFRLTLPLNRD